MKIAVVRRMTDPWLAAVQLAQEVYAKAYQADIMPAPDSFIVACSRDVDPVRTSALLACAGLTFGGGRPLFSERYLDRPIESYIEERFGAPADRRRIVEVGSLATRRPTTGRELIRATPIISWCLGMEYILCTATKPLVTTLDRTGIEFVSLSAAEPDRLTPEEISRWGDYYHHGPQVGVIPLNSLQRLFADTTGRYSFSDMQLNLVDRDLDEEMVSHAGR